MKIQLVVQRSDHNEVVAEIDVADDIDFVVYKEQVFSNLVSRGHLYFRQSGVLFVKDK